MKVLGVIIDCKLKFQDHIKQKMNKVYGMLCILRRKLKEMDAESFISLYKVFVRSHLEYVESVCNPHYMYLIDDLEKVQKQATNILRQCSLYYRQRLKFLSLPTLAFRRNRDDMIEVYKILTGKYDPTYPVGLFYIATSIASSPDEGQRTEIVHILSQVRFMQI